MAKRVSFDEKKKRILNLIQYRRTVLHMQELEKLAAKDKLVNVNQVKGIIEGLVDDTLVDADRFGTSTFMWSFPTKAASSQKRKLDETNSNNDQITKRLKVIDNRLNEQGASGDMSMVAPILAKIIDLKIERDQVSARLVRALHNNPVNVKNIQDATQEVKTAANRWTDNVFQIKTWCRDKMSIEGSVFDAYFKVSQDFDYL